MSSSPPPSPSLGSAKKRLRSQVEEDEEESVWCGICYAKRGVSIAGEIDCCKHYFCFVCIMEWAKHESRCPICRQRFSNVRRLPVHGVFSPPRDIKIPHRDQGHHHHENIVTGPVNPYAEHKCLICHDGTNEHLLLHCNYCETLSHSYCVGLGYTIPEYDWYCHDCAIAREAYINEESEEGNIAPEAEANVTIDICDIVRETGSRVVRRPRRASPLEQDLSSPSVIPLHDRLSRLKGKRPVINMRNIQALRENWNDLRSGSLQFRGNSFQPGSTVSQKQDSSSLSHHKLNDSHSMASTHPQQSIARGRPSNKMLNERIIDKAWEMMDRAKRMKPPHQRTRSIPQGVDNPSCSRGARKITFGHCNLPVLKDQLSKALELRSTKKEKQCDYSRLNRSMENCQSLKLEEKRKSRVTCEEMIHVKDHTTHSEGYCERPLYRMVHSGIQAVQCRENGDRNVAEDQNSSACRLVTSADLASSRDKLGSVSSSNRDMDPINEGKRLAKNSEDGNTRKNDDAKTEIQSLAKLNLKLLTRDKKLRVDTFKLVARQATHTILAACSSEHQKSSTSSSSPVCSHADQILQIQKSNLMPNCCRQCFYAFVNNVVNSVLLEKVGCP